MGLEDKLPEGIVTTQLEALVNWSRANSTWPLLFGLACCAIEMIAAGTVAPRHRALRLGTLPRQPAPGRPDDRLRPRVSNKMAPVIKRLHDQMSEPKWVIAMGICASAGGPFNNYAIIQGVDKIIPGRRLCAWLPAATGRLALCAGEAARKAGQRDLPPIP